MEEKDTREKNTEESNPQGSNPQESNAQGSNTQDNKPKEKKSRKTMIMGIIIGVLAVAVVALCIVLIVSGKNDSKNGTNEGTTEETSDAADITENEPDSETEEIRKSEALYSVEINADSTWENGDKKCATENVTIYNNSDKTVTSWSIDIIFASEPKLDGIWNGKGEVADKTISVESEEYNTTFGPGESVNFGFNVTADDITIADYTLYINGNKYTKSDMEDGVNYQEDADAENKTTEETVTDEVKQTEAESYNDGNTPVSAHGKLKISGTDIVDENGSPYQLKGCSTHGLTWYPEYVNYESFKTLRDEWGANLVRLAMYTDTGDSYGYCSGGDKDYIKGLVNTGVDAATDLGMYVIIDWHILNDCDPNTHIDEAKEFFGEMSEKYADYDNVIFEICNEPNGGTTWEQVKSYAEEVIPVIRENTDAIIIVGTPTWSQDVDIASANPVEGYDNIMYAVHFYAATHKDNIRNKVQTALDSGIPVFVSEFSICDASGNGNIDYDEADKWFDMIYDNNLSYAAWSLSNKEETSALINSSCDSISDWEDGQLSETGIYIKNKIMGN